jgi:urea transporter/murein DD-endopeptidase MepM/ murein hydrolase activator NlpD
MKRWFNVISSAYSGVYFLGPPVFGILMIGITLLNPPVALAGLVSAASAYLFARMIRMQENFFNLGFYVYNPLLVGMSIGYLFKPALPTILLVMIGGVLAFLCTVVMANLFFVYLKLPVLSLPFVFISTIVYLASFKYANLAVNELDRIDILYQYLPLWLSGYFKSLGAIFFMPQVAVGIVISLCILAGSRILFALSLMGYYGGTAFTALMMGSFSQAFTDINQFNAILAAMAVGGVFLIPSLKSYILALTAVGVSTVFLHSVLSFWWYAKIPGFTLPFNVVVLGFLYVLGLARYPQLVRVVKPTPEETLDWYLLNRYRISEWDTTIMLPFSGKWTVWQGFDGQWTHRGNWKYAYDFIVTDSTGSSFRGRGSRPEDYYAHGKPVLSPVRGTVVKTVTHLPDNPIGQPDKNNNWGNLVIIWDQRGFFVEISHFSPSSIRVKEGEEVQQGTFLGLCGNSGYSNQPHIHIQVQLTASIGAYTIPFAFVNYTCDNYFYSHGVPEEGMEVASLYRDSSRDAVITADAGDVHRYQVVRKGKIIDQLQLEVGMAADGTLYFDSGRGKLYFGMINGTFYFYSLEGSDPYLKTMLTALPQFPLGCRQHLHWEEPPPVSVLLGGGLKAAVQFFISFYHDLARVRALFSCPREHTVVGTVQARFPRVKVETLVKWDEKQGFTVFKVGSLELRKCSYYLSLANNRPGLK